MNTYINSLNTYPAFTKEDIQKIQALVLLRKHDELIATLTHFVPDLFILDKYLLFLRKEFYLFKQTKLGYEIIHNNPDAGDILLITSLTIILFSIGIYSRSIQGNEYKIEHALQGLTIIGLVLFGTIFVSGLVGIYDDPITKGDE